MGAPACGDVMKRQVEIDDFGIIRKAVFKTFGCGSAIASSSYITEFIKNKHMDEVETISNRVIAKYLNLPTVKLHCTQLGEEAIKSAIQNYKQKNT